MKPPHLLFRSAQTSYGRRARLGPEYYYVLFEDPDGIRLEVNHVPVTGLLNTDASFGSADDYVRKDGEDLIDHR